MHRKIHLKRCQVVDIDDTESRRNAFQILSADKSIIVFTRDGREKADWMDALQVRTYERLM